MTYYNTTKILDIIKMYNHNKKLLAEYKKQYASVGVTQYGIESTLPRASGNSDITANAALQQVASDRYYADIQTDIKYLEDRWDRITEEEDAEILHLRLQGYSSRDIAVTLGISKGTIHRRLRGIAATITLT